MKPQEQPKEHPSLGSRARLRKVAKHEAGHLLLNWFLGNRPCGAMLLPNGEAFTTAERTDDGLFSIGLVKVAGFVVAGEKRHLRSLRANWNKPHKFAVENDCFWVTTVAQHALDELAPNLGWLFIEALIRTVEEVCRTYHAELDELASVLEKVGYIKYPETERIFEAMDMKYKVKCPDWVVDRCIDYVQIVGEEHSSKRKQQGKEAGA